MTKTKSESKRFLKRGLVTGLTTAVVVAGAILSPTAAMAVEHHAHGHQYPEAWEVPNISTKTDGSTYGLFLKNTATGAIQPFQLSGLAHHPGYSAYPSTQGQSEHTLIYSSYFGTAPSSDGSRQQVGNGYAHQFNIIHGAQGDPSRQMTSIWDARVLFQLADTPVNTKEDAAAVALAIQVLVQRDRIQTEGWTEHAMGLLNQAKSANANTQWVYGSVDAAGNFTEDTRESFGSDSAGSLALAEKAKAFYDEAVRTLGNPDENVLNGTPFTLAWDEGSNTSGTLTIGDDLTLKNGEVDFLDYATYSGFGASFDPALPSKLEAGETYHWTVQSEKTTTVQAKFDWEEFPNTTPTGLVYGDQQIHNLSAIHAAYNYQRQLTRTTPVAPTVDAATVCGESSTVIIPNTTISRLFNYEQTMSADGKTVTVTATPKSNTVRILPGAQNEWVLELPEVEGCAADDIQVTPIAPTVNSNVACGEESYVQIPEVEGVKYIQVYDGNLVTVTATAEEGYIIADGAVTEWTIEIPEIVECDTDPETPVDPEVPETEVVTPVAPTLSTDVVCGEEATVEIPDVEGVRYEVAREGNTVTVTAVPEEGYSFTEGTDREWTFEIPQVIDCSVDPENPGTDPENPGTDPENPGTDPENPGTDPENPGTDPENPGTDPENPGTDPENPGTDPENPGTDPENPGTDPENPGTDPENPGTDPENPGTDPENPGTDPENPGTDPENPGTDPENPGTDPENPGTDPENPGTDPENPGTDPENPGTDPENPGTDPENPGADPENPGTDPENPGTDPENPGTDPENPGTDPENPGTDPENPGNESGNNSNDDPDDNDGKKDSDIKSNDGNAKHGTELSATGGSISPIILASGASILIAGVALLVSRLRRKNP